MDPTSSGLLIRDEGFVRILRLDRPERSNALSRGLISRIIEAVSDADDDPAVRVLVLTGSGERTFCAGLDLKEMAERDQSAVKFRRPMRGPERNVFEVVLESHTPTIAALNGHAVAGGLELALACDLRIASSEAKLGMPEAKRGMGANFASVVLPRLVPKAIALEMLFTGEYITAPDAARWGLVNRVVPPGDVLSTALDLAAKIAANAPLSVRRMKDVVNLTAAQSVQEALRMDFGADPYMSEDRKEGVRAFVEGRAPEWRGR